MTLIAVSTGTSYTPLAPPSSYSCIPNEISKAGRNAVGLLYKDRITVKNTIKLQWNAITPAQKSTILSLTSGNSFHVQYFDVQSGTTKYGLFYRGNDLEVTPLVNWSNADNEFTAYSIKMSMVEF